MLLFYLTQDEYKSHIVPRKVLEVVDVHDRGHSSFEVEQLGGRTYFCTCTSVSNQTKWISAMREALQEPDRIAQEEIEEAQRFLLQEENEQNEAVGIATEAIKKAQEYTQSVVDMDVQIQEMKLLRAKVEETLQHTATIHHSSTQNHFNEALLIAGEQVIDRQALSIAPPTLNREDVFKRLEEEFDLLTSVIAFLTRKRTTLMDESQTEKQNAVRSLTKAQSSKKSIQMHLQAWKSYQYEHSEPDSTQSSLRPDRVFTTSHLDAIAEGYLLCKHPTKRSQMQRRYYVLFGNTLCWFKTADSFLALNRKKASYHPLGLAHVESCEDWNGKLSSSKVVPHAFLIETTEGKTMYCSAPTRSIAENWKHALYISITMPSMSPHRALAARFRRSSFDLSIPLQNLAQEVSPERTVQAVFSSHTMEGYLLIQNEVSSRMEKKFVVTTSLSLFVYETHEEYESYQLGRLLESMEPLIIRNVLFLEDYDSDVKAFLKSYANGFILEMDTLKRLRCRAPNAREKENWIRVIQSSLPLSKPPILKEIERENTNSQKGDGDDKASIDLDTGEEVGEHSGELRWFESEQWEFTVLSGKKLTRFEQKLGLSLETVEIQRVVENVSDDHNRFIFHVNCRDTMDTNWKMITLECRTAREKQSWLNAFFHSLNVRIDEAPHNDDIEQVPGLLDVCEDVQSEQATRLLDVCEDVPIEQVTSLPEASDKIVTEQASGLLDVSDDVKTEQVPGLSEVSADELIEPTTDFAEGFEDFQIGKELDTTRDLFRAYLVRFYNTYNPSKLASLDELIAHFSGNDGKRHLLKQLDAVYGTSVSSDPEITSLIEERSTFVGTTKPAMLMEGYLLKRGHRIPSMRKRYFVLQSVDPTLRYFETKEDAEGFECGLKPLGEFQVANVCSWHGRTLTQTHRNGMQIEARDGRIYFCVASSEIEKENWIRAFHHAIASREALCEGPETLSSPLREKLSEFYERVNPSKLCDLDLLLHCYKDRETALLEAIDVHYGTSITADPEWLHVLPEPSPCRHFRLTSALDTLSYEGQILRASRTLLTSDLISSDLNHLYDKSVSLFAVVSGITLKLYSCRAQWKEGTKPNSIVTILSVKDLMENAENDLSGRFAIETADHTWLLFQALHHEDKGIWLKVLHAAIDAVFGQSILAEEQHSWLDTLENVVWIERDHSFERKALALRGNTLRVGIDSDEVVLLVEGISAWEVDVKASELPEKYPFQIDAEGGVKLRCLVENDVIRAHWIRTIRRNVNRPENRSSLLQTSHICPNSHMETISSQELVVGPLLAWKHLEASSLPVLVCGVLQDNHLQLKKFGTENSSHCDVFVEGFVLEMKAWKATLHEEMNGGVQVDFCIKPGAERPETAYIAFTNAQVRTQWYEVFPKTTILSDRETHSNVSVEEVKIAENKVCAESGRGIANCMLEGHLEIRSNWSDSHWHFNVSLQKAWKKHYVVVDAETSSSVVHWLIYATRSDAVTSSAALTSSKKVDGPLQVYNVIGGSEMDTNEWFYFEVMYWTDESDTSQNDILHCRTKSAEDRNRWLNGIKDAIRVCESYLRREKESLEIRSKLQNLEFDARRQSIQIRESLQIALEAVSDSDSSQDAISMESRNCTDDELYQNDCTLDLETLPMRPELNAFERDELSVPQASTKLSFWTAWPHTVTEYVQKTFTCIPRSNECAPMCHIFFPDTNCHFVADITGVSDPHRCGKQYTCDYFSQDA